MVASEWQLSTVATLGDAELAAAVEARFRHIYLASFANELCCNRDLPIQLRALRRVEEWRVFLLLTPWMLVRMFLPRHDPGIALPDGWTSEERSDRHYVVIGPTLDVVLASGRQQAHLNHDPELGHHLVQPLVLTMEQYPDAESVFAAWNDVIATRDRVMAEQQRDCPWQKEVSRREWFSQMLGGKS
jgi:hypothetical protein